MLWALGSHLNSEYIKRIVLYYMGYHVDIAIDIPIRIKDIQNRKLSTVAEDSKVGLRCSIQMDLL